MIEMTVILRDVPHYLYDTLQEDIIDIQDGYSLEADCSINREEGYICIDIDSKHKLLYSAIHNTVDLMDDMGLSPYIMEVSVV